MEAGAARMDTMDSDLELVTRYRYGDLQAFDELYARYSEMVYNLALRWSGDPEEAADLSQEAFLRIHRHLAGFRGRSSLGTWIYRITLNCCRSRYRSQRWWRTRREIQPDNRLERVPDPRRGPEERAISRDSGEYLRQALDELPPMYREVVLLRDLEGLTYREISQVLGIRLGTVRSRIARGRERLRLVLEERT